MSAKPFGARVTLRVPANHVADLEQRVEDGEFPNRSEAMREAIRVFVDGEDQR